MISIPYSYQSPESFIQTNVLGTLNVLEVARQNGIDKLIQTSTSEVYGSAKFVPITEEHLLNGQSPYSASKIASDQLAYSYYSSYNVPVVILRPFNTYGPRQSLRAIIPTIIFQIINGKKIINLGNINTTRDFNFINDTVNAFVKCLHTEKGIGEAINVGSGFECSIIDLVKIIADILNVKVKIEFSSERIRPKNSEVDRLLASNSKAKSMLDWTPEHDGIIGLKKGLTKTIRWFQNKKNMSFYKDDGYKI